MGKDKTREDRREVRAQALVIDLISNVALYPIEGHLNLARGVGEKSTILVCDFFFFD